ncbi:hypothetical protein O3M35_009549 [Rhynocoris fuscipes]|uniref:protein-serine/threonine phosphatase n=1 Tax=Rhynocoris fuscipes TaxID=488301 RepID=A0AAW1D617_9HEMI
MDSNKIESKTYEVQHVEDKADENYYYFKRPDGTKERKQRAEKKVVTLVQPPLWSKAPIQKAVKPADIKEPVSSSKEPKTFQDPSVNFINKLISLDAEGNITNFLNELKIRSEYWLKKKDFKELCNLYNSVIEKFPNNPDFYCNRSYAYYKMEYYEQAICECNEAIKLNEHYKRAYYRRAAAYIGQGKLNDAVQDFEHLLKFCPNSNRIKCLYLYCKDALNKSLFNSKLNANKSDYNVEDLIDINDIKIEEKHKAPKIRGGDKITQHFVNELMKFYRRHTYDSLHRKTVYKILMNIKKVLKLMPSLIYVDMSADDDKITVCGDIHGQLHDLLHIFETNGFPSAKNRYLFNGNFIGKGYSNVETALLLFSLKIVYPARLFLARGHHETLSMTLISGFKNEVIEKYSPIMYELFGDVFKWLPLAHVLNRRVLVLHGGLFSENYITLNNIKKTIRNIEPEEEEKGIVSDILWSDPMVKNGKDISLRGPNGIRFGPDVTEDFLERNDLDYIIRSHEYREDGYQEDHKGKCITVFSTPNYCNYFQNKSAIIQLTGPNLIRSQKIYKETPHPSGKKAFHYADTIYALEM